MMMKMVIVMVVEPWNTYIRKYSLLLIEALLGLTTFDWGRTGVNCL